MDHHGVDANFFLSGSFTINGEDVATQAWVDAAVATAVAGGGSGDMTKAVYDPDDDGIVTAAASVPWSGVAGRPTLGASAGNVPVLDSSGKLVDSVIPALAITTIYTVNTEAQMLALTAQRGDIARRTDLNTTFFLSADDPTEVVLWKELLVPAPSNMVSNDTENQTVTGGASITPKPFSTMYGGTFTLDVGDRAIQNYSNAGNHTLAPGAVTGACMLDIQNGSGAGVITTTGWTKVAGDAFTTTVGDIFRCHCSVGPGGSLLIVQAMQ